MSARGPAAAAAGPRYDDQAGGYGGYDQPSQASMYDDPKGKLLASSPGSIDEYSDEEYSDEETVPIHHRGEAYLTCLGCIALGILGLLLARSLMPSSAGSSEPVFRTPIAATTQAPIIVATTAALVTSNPLIPSYDLHDDNVCKPNEEFYGGLCYMRCALLTNGTHPIRTSSWTCCEKHPCGITGQKGKIGSKILCNGFDVDGDGNCPHEAGACLTDEETFLGVCYKKCNLLTNGDFPHRVAPATCCVQSGLSCLDIRKSATSSKFVVGGGDFDGRPDTPGQPHYPNVSYTEEDAAAKLTTPQPTIDPSMRGYMGDQARCGGDEELYAGLCYKQCSLLTNGTHPIRTSTWTCCSNHPCGIHNQKGAIGKTMACNGYGVGGNTALKVSVLTCPHAPNPCPVDAEEVLGMCFKPCAQLTNGDFPYRLSAVTCCKAKGIKACLDFGMTSTGDQYNTG